MRIEAMTVDRAVYESRVLSRREWQPTGPRQGPTRVCIPEMSTSSVVTPSEIQTVGALARWLAGAACRRLHESEARPGRTAQSIPSEVRTPNNCVLLESSEGVVGQWQPHSARSAHSCRSSGVAVLHRLLGAREARYRRVPPGRQRRAHRRSRPANRFRQSAGCLTQRHLDASR